MSAPVRAGGAPAGLPAAVPTRAVIISEVAWAGTSENHPSDEWVELYNPGTTTIDLTNWMLVTDTSGLYIPIPACNTSCLLPGGGFFLLENGSDGVVSDIPADLIYSPLGNELLNSGDVLRLMAPDGQGSYTEVDTANLGMASGWYAGSDVPTSASDPTYASMERVDVVADGPGEWASNNGINANGQDADGLALQATPRQMNSTWIQAATDTPTATSSSSTPTSAVTNTPAAPGHLVISEFRSRGLNGDNDEFVEIFNPTGTAFNIGGWSIKKSNGCGGTVSTLFTFPTSTILLPGQHYLAASNLNSSVIAPDRTFTPGIDDTGGLALFTSTGSTPEDAVGMCISTLYREGVPLDPLIGNSDQSYERNPAGPDSGCYDMNNNATDFRWLSSSSPRNSHIIQMCSGVPIAPATATKTATATGTPTKTRTPTRTPTALPGFPVLNEFLPHPRSDWNADGVANYGDEYIEIINIGSQDANLKNWMLDDGSGENPYKLPEIILKPREIVRFYGSVTGISLSDGGDGVRLIRPNGLNADAFYYPVVEAADRTWCRLPDGNGLWTFGCWPTPGRPNQAHGEGEKVPGEALPACLLADSLPSAILNAECGSPGDSIWAAGTWRTGEFWLSARGKLEVFIE